jgi:hypothetical protein
MKELSGFFLVITLPNLLLPWPDRGGPAAPGCGKAVWVRSQVLEGRGLVVFAASTSSSFTSHLVHVTW